jgi:hypothetical protein
MYKIKNHNNKVNKKSQVKINFETSKENLEVDNITFKEFVEKYYPNFNYLFKDK